jgi:UDP-2-acetamido-3-amino-2,3-dideoxy-glucuronate N-acetyltransferase
LTHPGGFFEHDVVLDDRVTVKSGVRPCCDLTIEGDVFDGPNVTFANDTSRCPEEYRERLQRRLPKAGRSIDATRRSSAALRSARARP